MSGNPILSGSGMAVLCGFICIILSIFGGNSFDFVGKIMLFFIGIALIIAGLVFSRG